MPTIKDLWGRRPLSELAEQIGIPFRRLEAYASGARQIAPADRAALAAFFGIAPEQLTGGSGEPPARRQRPAAAGKGKPPAELPPVSVVRPARPESVPPPTSIVTSQGTALARVTGVLQRAPEPAPDSKIDREGPRFWLLELLIPHQPLRGEARYPPIPLRCAVHRRLLDPFRWLEQGDKVVLTGSAVPRSNHLYLFADTLSTPRADLLGKLLAEQQQVGAPDAEAGLVKLLGSDWRATSRPTPGRGVQTARPPWAPPPTPPIGPQGRVQLSLTGQLQSDPTVELDEATGGTAELRLDITPAADEGRLPVVRYRVQMRLRTLRDFRWLQRGDSVVVSGDIARLGPELLVEAATLQLPS